MSTTVTSTIDIDATPDAVWAVLTDFPDYGQWNPFMDRIEGTAEVGRTLTVHMTNGGRGMTFKPTVLAAVPGSELRWLGTLVAKRLFAGEHSFVLTPTASGGTRLVHSEEFSGVLVAAMKGTLGNTGAGFTAFNEALKQRVETTQPVQ